MKILNPNDGRKLRAMIAKALDKASTDAEKHGSALAACRLLADFGLGVDSESIDPVKTLRVALVLPNEVRADADESPGGFPDGVYINLGDLFNDLFGGGFAHGARQHRRAQQAQAAAEAEQKANNPHPPNWEGNPPPKDPTEPRSWGHGRTRPAHAPKDPLYEPGKKYERPEQAGRTGPTQSDFFGSNRFGRRR